MNLKEIASTILHDKCIVIGMTVHNSPVYLCGPECPRCAIDRLIAEAENTDLVKKWQERARIARHNGPPGDYVSGRTSPYQECANELSEWLAVRGIR